MQLKPMISVLLLVFPAGILIAGGSYPLGADIESGAEYVGPESCLDCHEDIGEALAGTPHRADPALPVPGSLAAGCEACHGPGSLHIDNEGEGHIRDRDFMATLADDDRVSMCLQCHTNMRAHWYDGPHAGTAATCAVCHSEQVHFDGETRSFTEFRNPSEFCLQCHEEKVAEFRMPFRHRVLEGEVACTDCHSPHGAVAESNLFEQMKAACLGCHAEMAGPFVFEHEGVTAEECTTCHRPHGSINDKLLITDTSSLCRQCHYEPDFETDSGYKHASFPTDCTDCHGSTIPTGQSPHAGGGQVRCYDCHVEMHGSNTSPTFVNN